MVTLSAPGAVGVTLSAPGAVGVTLSAPGAVGVISTTALSIPQNNAVNAISLSIQ